MQRVHDEQAAAAPEFLPVFGIELGALELLAGEGLHHPHPGQILLEGGREYGLLFLVVLVGLRDSAEKQVRHRDGDRYDDHRKQCQPGVQLNQDRQIDQEHQHDPAGVEGLIREESADGIHIRGSALNQLPGPSLRVIGEREPLEVVEQILPQALGDAFRRTGRPPAADISQAALHQGQADEAGRHPGQVAAQIIPQQHNIDEMSHQQIADGAGDRGDPNPEGCQQQQAAESAGQPPQPHQAASCQGGS